eukprot:6175720-Pleurochrysis_carterae.AAC.2
MPLSPPPRQPPFDDWKELVEELVTQLNGEDLRTKLPVEAASEWDENELRMFFMSGGTIAPSVDPKLRAQASRNQLDSLIPHLHVPLVDTAYSPLCLIFSPLQALNWHIVCSALSYACLS